MPDLERLGRAFESRSGRSSGPYFRCYVHVAEATRGANDGIPRAAPGVSGGLSSLINGIPNSRLARSNEPVHATWWRVPYRSPLRTIAFSAQRR
jgi:hypothetical protein